jgi:hypothetical protein
MVTNLRIPAHLILHLDTRPLYVYTNGSGYVAGSGAAVFAPGYVAGSGAAVFAPGYGAFASGRVLFPRLSIDYSITDRE